MKLQKDIMIDVWIDDKPQTIYPYIRARNPLNKGFARY